MVKIIWRKISLLVGIGLALAGGMSTAAAQRDLDDPVEIGFPPGAALPDLQALPITDLILTVNPSTGVRELRFSNSVANTGHGPLELFGQYDEVKDTIVVTQHIYSDDETIIEPLDGSFYFSGEHMHWHWEDFAAYEIWAIETGGDLSRLVLAKDKVGFCLFDTQRVSSAWVEENVEGELVIAPRVFYSTCWLGRQGISVGWMDIYRNSLPGQAIDISDLKDGVYALRSVADPLDVIHELNNENNDTVLYFSLHGNELLVLGEEFSLLEYFAVLVDEGKIGIENGKVLVEEEEEPH
jgi:hypothetical protein